MLEELIKGKPERLLLVLTRLLMRAMSIPNDTAETIVHFVQAKKSYTHQGRLRTGQQDRVIPADIGCIPSLQMAINLTDNIPVQRAYSSIPKPLFAEVKEYIQDLIAKGWIVKSKSPYSAPVVCVRKKDGSLRLCIDYRLLNQKTVPERHPLPRIQDLTDTLGGHAWFSILDQGKAYHQGFIDEGSRHLTAFITP